MPKLSFSPAVYRMWLRRFWAGGALMLFPFLLAAAILNANMPSAQQIQSLIENNSVNIFSVFITAPSVSLLIAAFVAGCALVASLLCFHYLQDGRSAVMVHSLPPRREGLFLSACAAGLTLLLVPILLAGLLFAGVMALHRVLSVSAVLVFIFVMASIAILTFGVTSFVGMFTGSFIAQGALTLVFVNLPYMLENVLITYCDRYLFGFWAGTPFTASFNPILVMRSYLANLSGSYVLENRFHPGVPLVFMLLGLLFLLLGMLLYRLRHIENAGNIIAMRGVKPIFRFAMALFGALAFSTLLSSFFPGSFPFGLEVAICIAGGVLFYFVAEMLLRRTVRVFRHFRGALAFAAAYLLLMLGLYYDVVGYGSYRLNPNDVVSITFELTDDRAVGAMEGGPLNPFYVYADLGLEDVDGYLEAIYNSYSSLSRDMPAALAQQILERDPLVYKGEDAAKIVALQNMIAENAGQLRHTQTGTTYDYTVPGRQYYDIPFIAKLANGSVVKRFYRFMLEEDQLPELNPLYRQAREMNIRGESQRSLNMMLMAESLQLEYNLYDVEAALSLPGHTPQLLYSEMLKGFAEAFQKDLAAGTDIAATQKGYNQPILNIIPSLPQPVSGTHVYVFSSFHISVYLEYENCIQWLVENELLTQEELNAFREINTTRSGFHVDEGAIQPLG